LVRTEFVMAEEDDDRVFVSGPAPGLDPSDEGDDRVFVADAAPDAVGMRGWVGIGRPREPERRGVFGVFLVTEAFAPGAVERVAPVVSSSLAPGAPRRFIGCGVVEWTCTQESVVALGARDVASVPVSGRVGGRLRAGVPWAFVDYELVSSARLARDWEVPPHMYRNGAISWLDLKARARELPMNVGIGETVLSYIDASQSAFHTVLELPAGILLHAMAGGSDALLRSVPLGARVRRDCLLGGVPSNAAIKRWRRDMQARELAPGPDVDEDTADIWTETLLELPATGARTERVEDASKQGGPDRLKRSKDPVKIIHALRFASFLKSTSVFSEAVTAAVVYNDSDSSEVERDDSKDNKRATIDRQKARLDAVGMALDRREFAADMAVDAIAGINIYSDASPVSGAELQGMVVDCCMRDKTVKQTVLPGSTLSYGHYDAIAKTVAFLWSAWLMVGPTREAMEYFLSKVVSLTTDFGIEMHTVEMPCVLHAFMAWIAGEPLETARRLVDYSKRLFPNALRIAGWSHVIGGVMKQVANRSPTWPSILDSLRAL
jgi:hypothetical protein